MSNYQFLKKHSGPINKNPQKQEQGNINGPLLAKKIEGHLASFQAVSWPLTSHRVKTIIFN